MTDKEIQTPANTDSASPLVLMILDGWGSREDAEDNAISQASTPCWDQIQQLGVATTIKTSGEFVGLPAGQMGNSEVGHMNIGAGRVVFQNLNLISNAIQDGSFAQQPGTCQSHYGEPKPGFNTAYHGSCCHPVACTATRIISSRWYKWLRRRALRKSGCTLFSTDATRRPAVPDPQFKKCRTAWMVSVMPLLAVCAVAIMRWTATSAGTGLKKPGRRLVNGAGNVPLR